MAKYGFKYDVYGNNADAVQAVQSGRADANLAGSTVAFWAAKQNPAVQTSFTVKTGLVWALAFRLDDKAGRDAAGSALKCMKADGTVAKMHAKWFGVTPGADSPPPSRSRPARACRAWTATTRRRQARACKA
jgi:ABC-type amino acid transport substrate-binding protein